jgi:multimeric flavodoxin WrbA
VVIDHARSGAAHWGVYIIGGRAQWSVGVEDRRLSMPRLLIVHHTPSPHTQEMFEAVVAGATDPEIESVEVVRRPALTVSPVEMLEADGYLLGSPANLGYISGALKHAFDCAYYQLLDSTRGRPFGLYLHGNEGTEGAERAVDTITTGLGWVKAAETVVVSGKPSKSDVEACWNLGATVAAQLMEG